MSLFLAFNFITANAAPHGVLGIHVVFSAKAYWDGQTKSCCPREKGGCCHIWLDRFVGPGQITGTMETSGGNLIFTASKSKGMQPETYGQLFNAGKFILDGPMTFSSEVLSKLGLRSDFILPAGAYSCSFNGDDIVITLKK